MGEPFSTAASAVGIISLGLQASSTTIKFCKAYSSLEKDLDQLRKHANSLESTVRLFETQRQQTPAPNSQQLSPLRDCSTACSSCIRDVESIVQKYEQHGHGLKGHGQKFIRKLRYPFDKDEFEELRSTLHQLNTSVNTHLHMLNLFVLLSDLAACV